MTKYRYDSNEIIRWTETKFVIDGGLVFRFIHNRHDPVVLLFEAWLATMPIQISEEKFCEYANKKQDFWDDYEKIVYPYSEELKNKLKLKK